MNPLTLNLNLNALTRRASLLTLGTVGLAAFSNPSTTAAKKNRGTKKGKKGNANDLKRCKQQAAAWAAFVTAECEADNPDCLELGECAAPLEKCQFGDFLECLQSRQDMLR